MAIVEHRLHFENKKTKVSHEVSISSVVGNADHAIMSPQLILIYHWQELWLKSFYFCKCHNDLCSISYLTLDMNVGNHFSNPSPSPLITVIWCPLTHWFLGEVVAILKWNLQTHLWIYILSTSCGIGLRWVPQNIFNDKSTLVQVMAWCRQAPSHYLSQCWPRSMSPYSTTQPQSFTPYFPLCHHNTWLNATTD